MGLFAPPLTATLPKRQQQLESDFNQALLRHQRQLRPAVERAQQELSQQGIDIFLHPEQLTLTPALMPLSLRPILERQTIAVLCAVESIYQHHFAADPARLLEFTRMSTALTKEVSELTLYQNSHHHGRLGIAARPDLALTNGGVQFLETNFAPLLCHFPAAELVTTILNRIPALAGILQSYRPEDSLAGAVAMLYRNVPDLRSKRIALTISKLPNHRYRILLDHYALRLRERQIDAISCDLDAILFNDLGAHHPDFGRLDVIYPFHTPPRPDHQSSAGPWLKALELAYAGHFQLLCDLGQCLLAPKSLLALISDPTFAPYLPPSVRNYVPFTRIVADQPTTYRGQQVDLLELLVTHQQELVLKASLGSSADGSLVGADVTTTEWAHQLSEILANDQPWVAQAWVATPKAEVAILHDNELELSQQHVDYGLFAYEHRLAGGVRRNTNPRCSRFTNSAQNGGVAPLFFVP